MAGELTSKRLGKTLRAAARYNLERQGFEVSKVVTQSDRDAARFSVETEKGSAPRFLVTVELME